MLLTAVAGYAVQFGAMRAKLKAMGEDLKSIRCNELPHIEARLDALPCAEGRMKNAECRTDPDP